MFCVQDPRLATYGGFSRTHPPSVPGALDDIGTAVPFPTNDAGADVSWAPKPMLEFRVGFHPTDPVSPSLLTRTCSVGTRAFPDAVDLSLMTDPEAQERYWSDAVKRTEEMLDEVYARLRATHGTPYFNRPAALAFSFYFRISHPAPRVPTELATFTCRR